MYLIDKAENALKDALLSVPFIRRIVDYFKSIPTHMDFEGQRKAERLYQVIIALFGAVGFVYGFILEQFSQTVLFVFIGSAISCVLILPPWPWFRKNSLQWQKPVKKEADDKSKQSKPKDIKKKKTQ